MRIQFERVVLTLLLLTLAGCYQQASESLQPVSQTEIPGNLPETAGGDQDLTVFPATATLPPITLFAPTRPVLETPGASDPSADTANGLATSEGDIPLTAEETAEPSPTQGTFITPISPLGPFTPAALTPTVRPGQPTATPSGLITPTAFADGAGGCIYTVRSGDNLFRIATDNNVSLADLRQANPQLSGDMLQPGQELQIPGCTADGSAAPTDTAGDTPEPPTAVAPAGSTTYAVQPGDTLFTIARRFDTTIAAIVEANNLSNPNALSIGQELIIPAPSN